MHADESRTPVPSEPTPAPALSVERGGLPTARDLRTQILGVKRRPPREVDLSRFSDLGFPDRVWIKGASAAARDAWEGERYQSGKKGRVDFAYTNVQAGLVARCLCDANGTLVFPDAKEGAKALGSLDSAPIGVLFEAAKEETGITAGDEEDMEAAEAAMEDELGNGRGGAR